MALLEERLPDRTPRLDSGQFKDAGTTCGPIQHRERCAVGGYLPVRVLHRRSRSYLRAIRSREPWHDSGHGCTHGPYGGSLSTQMTLHSYTRTRSKPLHGSTRWLPAPYRIHKKTRTSATPEADVAKLNLSYLKCESCAREFTTLRGVKIHMARWCDGVRYVHA